jgi:hypothetical protein
MTWSDGGEGLIGRHYLSLWRADELAPLNRDYKVRERLPHVVAIGTDGGGVCYAFDFAAQSRLIRVSLGDLCSSSIEPCGISLEQAVRSWLLDSDVR